MRAMVTGGAGFIGSHLAERLHKEGNEVLVLDSLASASSSAGFQLLGDLGVAVEVLDIRQERLVAVTKDFAPEVIFHLAAQSSVPVSVTDPIHDAKVNVVGTLRILEAAIGAGSRVVFASSGGTIYGEPAETELPLKEEGTGRPTSPYGISKRVAEDYLRFFGRVHGLAFASLALANVYGPRQDAQGESGVVAIFASKMARGEVCTIFGDGKQTRDYVYVEDVVDAFLSAVDSGDGETVNIGTGRETTVENLYSMMAGICGIQAGPRYEAERPGDIRRSCLEVSKANKVLGWRPNTSIDEGLRRTIDFFRIGLD